MPNNRPDHFAQFTTTAGILASIAGYLNAVTIVGAFHAPSTHVSGTVTRLSIDLATDGGGPHVLVRDATMIGAFVLGAALSGAVLDSTKLRLGRRYGVLLVLEALILGVAWWVFGASWYHLFLIALAAGLQNALATEYSHATVRTTHMTGILTDLGIALGKWLSRRGVTSWRVVLYLVILGGFVAGGVGGATLALLLGRHALLLPIAVTALGGTAYWVWRHWFVREASR